MARIQLFLYSGILFIYFNRTGTAITGGNDCICDVRPHLPCSLAPLLPAIHHLIKNSLIPSCTLAAVSLNSNNTVLSPCWNWKKFHRNTNCTCVSCLWTSFPGSSSERRSMRPDQSAWPIMSCFFYFPYKVISLVSAHGFDLTASETTKDGKQGKNRKPLSLSSFDKRIKLLFQTRRERLHGFVLKWWLDKHVKLNRFFSISPVGKQHKVCVLFINAGGLDRTPFVWIGIHSETGPFVIFGPQKTTLFRQTYFTQAIKFDLVSITENILTIEEKYLHEGILPNFGEAFHDE